MSGEREQQMAGSGAGDADDDSSSPDADTSSRRLDPQLRIIGQVLRLASDLSPAGRRYLVERLAEDAAAKGG